MRAGISFKMINLLYVNNFGIMIRRTLFLFLAGLILVSGCKVFEKQTVPENALEKYLGRRDKSFSWTVKDSSRSEGGIKVVNLRLTSQEWREFTWTHQLSLIVPDQVKTDAALLFITGGSNREGEPNWSEEKELKKLFSEFAANNRAVVAILRQVPNQPLYDDLTEDALISYTLHNFKSDNDFTWPLLFPMVKSAVSGMDAVQEYCRNENGVKIKRFVISGASKRGWTTWLTGSQDKRVIAIAPMVIDVLNMPVNVAYQKEVWGDYSVEISDYVKLGIAQDMSTPEGRDMTTMIDPYSYRDRLTMPKFIFIGTNDPYWPVDAIKNYYYELPGENYIYYEPNTGHDLGGGVSAIKSLNAFFNIAANGNAHHICSWHAAYDSDQTNITVMASDDLISATMWFCNSSDRDFRDNSFISAPVEYTGTDEFEVIVRHPSSGFRAFYIELVYPDPTGGVYSKCTRMFVSDSDRCFIE